MKTAAHMSSHLGVVPMLSRVQRQAVNSTPLLLAAVWVVAFGVLGWLAVLLVPNQSYFTAAAITSFILIPSFVIWMVGKAGQQGGWALAVLTGLVVFVSDATLRGGIGRGLDGQSALKFGVWAAGLLLALWRWREVKAALSQPAPLALAVFGVWCLLTSTYSATPLYTLGASTAFLGIWVTAVCMAKVFSPQRGLAIFIVALMIAMVISLALYALAPERVMTPMDGGRILRLSGLFGSPNNLGRAAALTLLLVCLAARHVLGGTDAVVGQVGLTVALNQQEEFRPGARFEGSVGWSHAFSPDWGTVLQVNAQHRVSDRGAQAEPLNSGSTTIGLSPGLTVSVGRASTVYAYAQVPVYQKVSGIQLVPRTLFAVGWTADF